MSKPKNTVTNKKDTLQIITFSMSALALVVSSYTLIMQSDEDDRYNEVAALVEMQSPVAPKSTEAVAAIDEEALERFIMENPTLIVKSLGKMRFEQEQQKKQAAAKKVSSFEHALLNKKTDPVIGNPNGKHVIVEFIDNNCGYCKKLAPVLERLIEIDPEAKIIVKEFPIFTNNPSSNYSALIGTAIWLTNPSKYAEFHKLVIHAPRLSNDAVDAFAKQVGAPVSSLESNLQQAQQLIQENKLLGNQLEVTGTPTMFINGERTHGGVTAEQLKAKFQ